MPAHVKLSDVKLTEAQTKSVVQQYMDTIRSGRDMERFVMLVLTTAAALEPRTDRWDRLYKAGINWDKIRKHAEKCALKYEAALYDF